MFTISKEASIVLIIVLFAVVFLISYFSKHKELDEISESKNVDDKDDDVVLCWETDRKTRIGLFSDD